MATGQGIKKKKVKKNVLSGVAHIQATFNNTIITITDKEGNVVTWSSSGTGIQRVTEKHSFRRSDGGRGCSQESHGTWNEIH